MEEKYRSLDEEIAGKTKKMKKLFGMLQSAKGEVDAIQRERREQVPHRRSTVCLPPVLRGGGGSRRRTRCSTRSGSSAPS